MTADRVLAAMRAARDDGASGIETWGAGLAAFARLAAAPARTETPAPTAWRAAAGDVLDELALARYGNASAVHILLDAPANGGVLAQSPRLAAGTLVALPETVPRPETAPTVQIWD